jgi:hypothetical protein
VGEWSPSANLHIPGCADSDLPHLGRPERGGGAGYWWRALWALVTPMEGLVSMDNGRPGALQTSWGGSLGDPREWV